MRPVSLAVVSASRASDGAYLAAIDVATIAQDLSAEYRIVGGNAVTLLAAAHGAQQLAPSRETADADFGAAYPVIADARLPSALIAKGYARISGNRFTRTAADRVGELTLAVDILAPSYGSRLLPNQPHGDLVVDEVPGLALALSRAPTRLSLDLALTSGTRLNAVVDLPDVISALCLKAYAYAGRFQRRDALDIWRLLAAAHQAGITAQAWPGGASARESAVLLRSHFGTPAARGLRDATPVRAEQTRIRALIASVVPMSPR